MVDNVAANVLLFNILLFLKSSSIIINDIENIFSAQINEMTANRNLEH